MAIQTETTRVELNGNGTAGPFQCGFRILNDSDLKVLVGGVPKNLTTHFTVANAGTANNAVVTFTFGNFPPSGTGNVVISRDLPNTQPTNYQNNTALDAETLEASFDRAVMQTQQIVTSTDRAIKFADDVLGVDADVTEISTGGTAIANKILGFDGNGEISATVELGTNRGDWAASTAFVVRDIVRDASNNNVYICITAHTSQGTTPISSNADVAKWQLIINASAVATSATNASTSETNAANSANAAATSANNAATSETNAGTSANNAATSANNASTSESNAASSANQAAASAANAATSYDSFDDRYLGTKPSAPNNDNDGNALVTGALYFDTTAGSMQVYDGSAWIAASAAQNVTILEYVYSITGNTTNITGSDDNSATLAFASQESVNVYLNGVQLIEGGSQDYTLSPSTNTVTLASNAVNGDVVKVVVFKTFTVGDAVPASTGGTFSGNVTHSGTLNANGIINANAGVDMQGQELVLDADADTSFHASTDDQIDIKVAGTDVGNFNSNTLKLVKDGTPVLEIEDTNETAYSGYWLTAPELHLKHSTDNANSEGVLGIIRFKGTTKTNIGVPSTPGSVDLVQIQGRTVGQGNQQRFSEVIGALSFRGMDGAGGFTELMSIEGKNLKIASGGGIDFSNATDHTTGESSVGSVLDDYEEGTWTPTFSNSGSATVTFAKYRKVGNMVTVWARLMNLNCPSYSATTLTIGTPVATLSNEEYNGGSFMGNGINIGGIITLSVYIYNNNFYFYYTVDNASSWNALNWGHFNTGGTSDILFCATYPCQ